MDFFEAFLLARQADGVSSKTISWHEQSFKTFRAWLKSQNIGEEPTWTSDQLRQYLVFLQHSGLAPHSVRTKAQSLFAFTRWLHEEGVTENDLRARLKLPKAPKVVKQAFGDDELRRLLKACRSKRDLAILSLMIDCGLRANEVCTIKVSDLVPQQNLVIVRGKGEKDRTLPYSSPTARAIVRWRIELRRTDPDGVYLFPSTRHGRLSPNSLRQMLARIAERAGVEHACLHKFRHTFAISFLRNGGDAFALQKLMGHSELSTTRVYVDLQIEDLQRAHAQSSPLMHLTKGGKRR